MFNILLHSLNILLLSFSNFLVPGTVPCSMPHFEFQSESVIYLVCVFLFFGTKTYGVAINHILIDIVVIKMVEICSFRKQSHRPEPKI